ncbi:MAG: F0F1 ATP synthase subunit B [Patescibacteria group bacterium]
MAQTTAPQAHIETTTATAHEAVPESAGIGALGVNGPLLAAQIVNFLIVLAVLRAVAYKPALAMLAKRRRMIEESVAQAEQTKAEAASSQQAVSQQLAAARHEARELLDQARASAEKIATEITSNAEDQSKRLLDQARVQIDQERAAMKASLEGELGGLVVAATERVLNGKQIPIASTDIEQALGQELRQHGA